MCPTFSFVQGVSNYESAPLCIFAVFAFVFLFLLPKYFYQSLYLPIKNIFPCKSILYPQKIYFLILLYVWPFGTLWRHFEESLIWKLKWYWQKHKVSFLSTIQNVSRSAVIGSPGLTVACFLVSWTTSLFHYSHCIGIAYYSVSKFNLCPMYCFQEDHVTCCLFSIFCVLFSCRTIFT